MDSRTRRGTLLALVGFAVLAHNLYTGVPFRLVGADGLFTASGAIYSPLLSYVFSVVLVVVGLFRSLRKAS
ncbi:hypothetical protein [Halococcus agarilyticus]|uniref:hypothetical protein n=1 Tax=Halococcus agarilyticus TaxID=1232219 RepID=UPI0012AB78B0|nr:hypothetical protein [Halococcus agarilyticus]